MEQDTKIYFNDFFDISKQILDDYGAFNISLIADLPLFIDPFLLFNSKETLYQALHAEIIRYLRFLKDKSVNGNVDGGMLASLYRFKEVEQNWLGYSKSGNRGSALGPDFANALNNNFHEIFSDYGDEDITKSAHLEKLCLIQNGVGKDNISDFTTNLIKNFLLEYTEKFAKQYLAPQKCHNFAVRKASFNYTTETWETKSFYLPEFNNDFVILTPKDILTKDNTWINKQDLVEDFAYLPDSVTDMELRSEINNYLRSVLPIKPKKADETRAALLTLQKFPVLVDYYIKVKEQHGDEASKVSNAKVEFSEDLYLEKFKELAVLLKNNSKFYEIGSGTFDACKKRCEFLKDIIENHDGHRMFYDNNNQPIQKEDDLEIAYRLTWFGSPFSVDNQVNNGRGPVDTKVSYGAADNTLVEFKLAKNTQLKRNLENQVAIYEKANNTTKSLKVILYFNRAELLRVNKILKELKLNQDPNIILINAEMKISASKAISHHASKIA